MGFGFRNIEHAFASVAKDIVHSANVLSLVASKLEKAAPEIETITGMIDPAAVLIERAAFALLGSAAQAATTVGDATQAKGLNVPLDEESIQQLKQIAAYLTHHGASVDGISSVDSKSRPTVATAS
jgi:hypothetical protein